MTTLSYDYKPKAWIMLLAVVFFGICTVVIGNMAINNDRGLILNRLFEFSQSGAAVFYWILTICCVGLTLAGIWGVLNSFGTPKQVVLSEASITAPKSAVSNVIIEIPYAEVFDIVDQKVQKQVFLVVHGQNTKITIAKSALADNEEFEQMRNALIERSIAQKG